MAPTPSGPAPAAGAAPLSLQPGPPQQPVVVGGPPGALPGAAARGHAAARRAPGWAWARSHGPHHPLRSARRASLSSPARWCGRRRGQGCPTKSLKLLLPPPPSQSSRPRRGGLGPGGRAGTGPESQCGRNPGLESEGRGGPECPGTPGRSPGRSPSAPLAPESRGPTSGRTRRSSPPAGVNGAHPRARDRGHRTGRTPGSPRRAPRYESGHLFRGPNEADTAGRLSAPSSLN